MDHDSQRVEIWGVRVVSSEKNFGCHIDRSSTGFIFKLIILADIVFGYSKVSKSRIPILFKNYIFRFQVFVDDIHWVDVLKSH